jgi:hypothetical protein
MSFTPETDSGESKSRKAKGGFWATVLAVELIELAFYVKWWHPFFDGEA